MEASIYAQTGQRAYVDAVGRVLKEGRPRTVRGLDTLDLGFTSILLESPLDALPIGTQRGVNAAIGCAEALQLIGGFSHPQLLLRISSAFEKFTNGDGFHGAYGSRIRHQMLNVATKLQRDSGTRQAIVTLWDPVLDNIPDMNDYPCTILLQFEVHDEKLCMNVVMRSNDVYLGLPYDMFQFTQLQLTLARSLGLAWGWYRHTALSLHAYVTDVPALETVEYPSALMCGAFQPQGIGITECESFTSIMKRARRLATGLELDHYTLSEEWYRDELAPHVG